MANLARVLTALGDPTRRAILERLHGRSQPVGEIAQGLPVSRPAVSQHLKVLKAAGLVADEQQGTRRIYRVDPEGAAALRAYLDTFWPRPPGETKPADPAAKPRVRLKPVVRRAEFG
jgi:DNA-binding transcriptional ArsR family regulator